MKPIQVLFENAVFLAVDKPAGLSVHAESTERADLLSQLGGDLHLVNRLDRETSGLVLLAKKPALVKELVSALNAEVAEKSYRCILRGPLKIPTPPRDSDKILWRWPLTDRAEGRRNPQGRNLDRIEALTFIHPIQTNDYFTEIRAQIKTGRQHQIRKHAALAGHPIVGDPRYNDPQYNQKIESIYKIKRMFLHAEILRFNYSGQEFEILSPCPNDFQKLWSQ